jgi:hypothetical protein
MRSRYLAEKIAFLVVVLFTVSYQCAAQCLTTPCDEGGTKVPACHRHSSTNREAPPDVCKAPLLLAAEIPVQSSNHPEQSTGMLLGFIIPDLVGEKAGLLLNARSWRPPEPHFPAEIRVTAPLRI